MSDPNEKDLPRAWAKVIVRVCLAFLFMKVVAAFARFVEPNPTPKEIELVIVWVTGAIIIGGLLSWGTE